MADKRALSFPEPGKASSALSIFCVLARQAARLAEMGGKGEGFSRSDMPVVLTCGAFLLWSLAVHASKHVPLGLAASSMVQETKRWMPVPLHLRACLKLSRLLQVTWRYGRQEPLLFSCWSCLALPKSQAFCLVSASDSPGHPVVVCNAVPQCAHFLVKHLESMQSPNNARRTSLTPRQRIGPDGRQATSGVTLGLAWMFGLRALRSGVCAHASGCILACQRQLAHAPSIAVYVCVRRGGGEKGRVGGACRGAS